ncbi:UDP-glucuronosyltransferase 2A1-like isoform X1 [Amphiura filiformis]|uniref:UDP-glucuronosyltransferase 2A1-like isoform X1 n=1 Tax=Amphiura filiformis TaxID=82378 RepID=UPI003B219E15
MAFSAALAMYITGIWLICNSPTSLVAGSNILITPMNGEGSHFFIAEVIGNELINRGHNVTLLLGDVFRKPTQHSSKFNYVYYKSHATLEQFRYFMEACTRAGLKGEYASFAMTNMSWQTVTTAKECDTLLSSATEMAQLRDAKFDVAVTDLGRPCPVAQLLGVPYVLLSPIMAIPSAYLLANRNEVNPAYMPDMLRGYDHTMTFQERLLNTLSAVVLTLVTNIVVQPLIDDLKASHGDLPDAASLLFTDAELWLLNSHFALDFPRGLLPNTQMVGGLTSKPPKPLSKDWEDFLQSAGDDGVVLFSMGSYATGIDEDIAALFAGAFAQLPQKVIWKLNGKPSSTLTANVKVVDWIPQNDLLAHPQIKVFVYHCGLNGIWEAVYHGVPMVAIPLFGDQFDNAQRLVSRGMGVKVDIATLTSDELAEAIRTVINNPSYKDNATRISSIFRDRSRTPAEEAADWLEYVIRHGGAKHLRSAALDLNIFQYFLLDVMAVLLVAFLTVFAILICCCRLCFRGCRKVCGRTTKAKSE